MIILGLETSCDETSAAVIADGRLLTNVVLSQEMHSDFGGVVPEIASREHENQIASVVNLAFERACISRKDLDGIAVTYGAGLMGALLVGLNFAKGLSIGLQIPFLGVNHLEGHLYANFIDNSELDYPFTCMLVSGGHTQMWDVKKFGKYALLGSTRDDAAGEAFDKGARILGLGYPGGPEIEKHAVGFQPGVYKFSIPRVKTAELDFSFSGIKTALLYKAQSMTEKEISHNRQQLCADYQEVIVDTLLDRLEKAVAVTGHHHISVAGGVAANKRFRQKATALEEKLHLKVFFPRLELCTDNAGMIAMAGYERMKNGEASSLSLKAVPNLTLGDLQNA